MGASHSSSFKPPSWLVEAVEDEHTPLTFSLYSQGHSRHQPKHPHPTSQEQQQHPSPPCSDPPSLSSSRQSSKHYHTHSNQQLTSEMLFPLMHTSMEGLLQQHMMLKAPTPVVPNMSIAEALANASRAKMLLATLDSLQYSQQLPSPTAIASFAASPVTSDSCPASPLAAKRTAIAVAL